MEGREGGGRDHRVQQKYACKLCSRSFPCGRSLGGHMRAHMASSSAEAGGEPALQPHPHLQSPSSKWVPGFHGEGGKGARYVLRENPKKTWRLHDSAVGEISPVPEKFCKECGKGFPSWKALLGHMRCHAVRSSRVTGAQMEQEQAEEARVQEEDEEAEEDGDRDGSWGGGSQKMMAVGMGMPRKGRMRARSKRVSAAMAVAASPSLSASEIRQELEDVALCLMMLSRDVGCWGGFHSVAESSDKNSAVLEEVGASTGRGDLRVFVPDGKKQEKIKNLPCEADLEESDDGERRRDPAKRPRLRRALADLGNTNSKLERCHLLGREKFDAYEHTADRDHGWTTCNGGSSAKPPRGKSSFECTTCGKAFRSYQALGGHLANHKRAKSCLAPKAEGGGENSVETAFSTAAEEEPVHHAVGFAEETSSGSQKKANRHECEICFKVFPSGQALGGHKRRHFSGTSGGPSASCCPTEMVQVQLPAEPIVLDLNLPSTAAAAAAAGVPMRAVGSSASGRGGSGATTRVSQWCTSSPAEKCTLYTSKMPFYSIHAFF